jgi:serpin B
MKSTVLKSKVERNLAPSTSESDLKSLATGLNCLAFKLLSSLEQGQANLFFSPFSISTALAMVFAGARGQTEQDMAQALHFDLPQDRLHSAFNSLDLKLRRGNQDTNTDNELFTLHIASALWGQKGFGFLEPFLDQLAYNYGSGLNLTDFIKKSQQSRRLINNWIAKQTAGKIEELVPEGAINKATRLLATNAIYFKASWKFPFDESHTFDDIFYRLDDSQCLVPFMSQTAALAYAEGDGYQALELPYRGGGISMLLLAPESGSFDRFKQSLDGNRVNSILDNLELHDVNLKVPLFNYKYDLNLKQLLSRLGMERAFSSEADFSGMSGNRGLYLQDVLHKAFIAINEKGTEAAAATAAIVSWKMALPLAVEMKLDRPFIYLIRHKQTGLILFAGCLVNPED